MELKVRVDGLQRVVCGLGDRTTCQEVIYALAHATGKTGRFVLVEKWRTSERSLSPHDRPLDLLSKWGEYAGDVQFVLRCLDDSTTQQQRPTSVVQQFQREKFKLENPGSETFENPVSMNNRRMNNSLDEHVKTPPPTAFSHSGRGGMTGASTSVTGGLLKPYFVDTSKPTPESGTLVRPTSAIFPTSTAVPVQQPSIGYQVAHKQRNTMVRRSGLSPTPISQQHRAMADTKSYQQLAGNGSLTVLSQSAHESLNTQTAVSLDSTATSGNLESSFSSFNANTTKQLDLSQTSYCSSSMNSSTSNCQLPTAHGQSQRYNGARPPPPSYNAFVMKKSRDQQLSANRSHQPSPAPVFGHNRSRTPVADDQRSHTATGSLTREQLIKLIQSQHAHLQAQRQTIHSYDIEIALRENSENDPPPAQDQTRRELQQLEVERARVKQKVDELRRQDLDGQLMSLRQSLAETVAETSKINEQLRSMDTQLIMNENKIGQISSDLEREKAEMLAMSPRNNGSSNDSSSVSNDALESKLKHSPVKNPVSKVFDVQQPTTQLLANQRSENGSGVWV